MLSVAKLFCPFGMNLVNRKCLVMVKKSCGKLKSTNDIRKSTTVSTAKFRPSDIPYLLRMLRTWHITPDNFPRPEVRYMSCDGEYYYLNCLYKSINQLVFTIIISTMVVQLSVRS